MRLVSPRNPNQTKVLPKKQNYRLVAFMNINKHILNKILLKVTQQYIKVELCHDQVEFILKMKDLFNIQKLVY